MKPEEKNKIQSDEKYFLRVVFLKNSSYFLWHLDILQTWGYCVCSHTHGERITKRINEISTILGMYPMHWFHQAWQITLFAKSLWSTKTPRNVCLLGPDHSSYIDMTVQHLSEKNSIKALDQERKMSYQLCTGSFWQLFHLYMHFNQF